MKLFNFTLKPKDVRRKLGMNQQEFWTKIGVTQSGGSRYESGREMPKPVRELLRLVHIEKLDLTRVRKEDFEVIEYLKQSHPDLYQNLRKTLKERRGKKAPNTEHRSSGGVDKRAGGEPVASGEVPSSCSLLCVNEKRPRGRLRGLFSFFVGGE